MNVLCVGFGYVGKAYALLLRELGHEVLVITADDKTYADAVNYGFRTLYKQREKFDVAVIAVPTPTTKDKQDITILDSVLSQLKIRPTIKNIIIKSTILPENIVKLEKKYKKKGQGFYLYPEFLEAKNPIGGVFNQTCCVFGKRGEWTFKEKFFISALFGLDRNIITFTTLETASMLKYIHNIWLSCNVSFWNAVMRCTKQFDADYELILKETHKSKYFGTHPWSIGTAYGGTCLPKDIKAFISSMQLPAGNRFRRFVEIIDEVNEQVKK